jgi:hypothetical protein
MAFYHVLKLIPLHFSFAGFFSSASPRSIKTLPAMAFENLNSLETLSIQNNKLVTIPEEVMEPIIDTLRVVDIMGEFGFPPHCSDLQFPLAWTYCCCSS